MAMKKWVVEKTDRTLAKELAAECDTDPIVALIAAARGYTDPTDLEQFLSDEPCFSDPRELADLEKAAALVEEELEKGTKIAVFGDYDCDGVTATALLTHYLRGRGAECLYRIPNRFTEGYGMTVSAVEELHGEGVGLIITVDNGISCHEAIARAKKLHMRVIVTDHHLPQETLPDADAVVDPHRADCPSSFKEICGAQVAFALICVLENREPEELIPYYADVLSVAVLADIMPLTLENRCIVKYGLEKLSHSPAIGLSALISAAGLDRGKISAGNIAFGIAPRINAAGRMGDASRAVELLLSDSIQKALEIATQLDNENALRQKTEKDIFAAAKEKIEQNGFQFDRVIVIEGEGWHPGVLGIAASRISERYGRPSVVISVDGSDASGSARSIEGFSIYDAIASTAELLTKFGGHRSAAGLSLAAERIPDFRKAINEYAYQLPFQPPVLKLDCKLSPAALSLDLAQVLSQLEPFGTGNPTPIFGLYEIKLVRVDSIGKGKHLRLIFSKGENSFQALLFGVSKEVFCFEAGDILDAAVTLSVDRYNATESLTVQIKALRLSGESETLFDEVDLFARLMSGRDGAYGDLLASRAQIGEIYKYITASPRLEDRIQYLFSQKIGYGKTMASLAVLQELGLIEKDNISYRAVQNPQKKDLSNSAIYRKISEGSESH